MRAVALPVDGLLGLVSLTIFYQLPSMLRRKKRRDHCYLLANIDRAGLHMFYFSDCSAVNNSQLFVPTYNLGKQQKKDPWASPGAAFYVRRATEGDEVVSFDS